MKQITPKLMFVTAFAILVSTSACDAVEDRAEAYDELAEAEDDAERAEAWDGLLPEDIAMLEMEDGTDIEDAPAADSEVSDFTAAPESAAAPSCIFLHTWDDNIRTHARVWNRCGSTKRVRIIWAWALDTPCLNVSNGTGYTSTRHRGAYVSEVRSC